MLEGGLEVVMFGFVKAVHVELTDETVHLVMAEVFGEDNFLEFGDVLDGELSSVRGPVNYFDKIGNLRW